MREAFTQAPLGEREGAFRAGCHPLGHDPHGGAAVSVAAAMIGGTMLGLGRALGETIAVVLIISPGLLDPAAHPGEGRQLRLGADRPALRRRLDRDGDLGADGGGGWRCS